MGLLNKIKNLFTKNKAEEPLLTPEQSVPVEKSNMEIVDEIIGDQPAPTLAVYDSEKTETNEDEFPQYQTPIKKKINPNIPTDKSKMKRDQEKKMLKRRQKNKEARKQRRNNRSRNT